MKNFLFLIVLTMIFITGCLPRTEGPLIYKKFKDKNTFLIACSGTAMADAKGIARFETAKRAALMNVYYFVRETFHDSVSPERDGRIDRVEAAGDTAIVHYIIRKRDLKSHLK